MAKYPPPDATWRRSEELPVEFFDETNHTSYLAERWLVTWRDQDGTRWGMWEWRKIDWINSRQRVSHG